MVTVVKGNFKGDLLVFTDGEGVGGLAGFWRSSVRVMPPWQHVSWTISSSLMIQWGCLRHCMHCNSFSAARLSSFLAPLMCLWGHEEQHVPPPPRYRGLVPNPPLPC